MSDALGSTASLREAAREIFRRSLQACSVDAAARSKWRRVTGPGDQDHLFIEGHGELDLRAVKHVLVIAAGKAAAPSLRALLEILPLPPGCALEGVLVAPEPLQSLPKGMQYFAGSHPLPNEASLAGARAALALLHRYACVEGAATRCFCFFLISGGASAILELPLAENISLADTVLFHQALVHCGATITEINCVRKHFSAVKGGRLRAAAGPMRTLTLAVSDVPAGELDVLGSGPTLPDPSTLADCAAVLTRYAVRDRFPLAVQAFFNSSQCTETPKPGSLDSPVAVLLSSEDLACAAQREAELLGFRVVRDDTTDGWDYREAADFLVSRMRELVSHLKPVCLVATGEVGVTIPQGVEAGQGGRNQQMALYVAGLEIAAPTAIVFLSAGSDGIDGNSTVAGAVVDACLLDGVDEAGKSLREQAGCALAHYDAFPLLERLRATLRTGRTENNLRDLRLLLAAPGEDRPRC